MGPALCQWPSQFSQTHNSMAYLYTQGFSRNDSNCHTVLSGFRDFFTFQFLVLRLHHLLWAPQINPQLQAMGWLLWAWHLGMQNAPARSHPLQTPHQQGNVTQSRTSLQWGLLQNGNCVKHLTSASFIDPGHHAEWQNNNDNCWNLFQFSQHVLLFTSEIKASDLKFTQMEEASLWTPWVFDWAPIMGRCKQTVYWGVLSGAH